MARYNNGIKTINGRTPPRQLGVYEVRDDDKYGEFYRNAEEALKKAKGNLVVQAKRREHIDAQTERKERIAVLEQEIHDMSVALLVKIQEDEANANLSADEIMEKYSADLAAVKEKSDEYEFIRRVKAKAGSEYDALLISLTTLTKKPFIYPEYFSLDERNYSFLSQLDKPALDLLLEKLEHTQYGNMFKIGAIPYQCIKYFPKYAYLLSDIESLKFALSLDPSIYPKAIKKMWQIHEETNQGVSNEELVAQVAGSAKTKAAFQYFTYADIVAVAKVNPKVVGARLLEYPEKISLLKPDFFDLFTPSLIFGNVNKQDVYKTFNQHPHADFGARFEKFMEAYRMTALKGKFSDMTYADICNIAKENPRFVGKRLIEYPEKIASLEPDFFDLYDPRLIFKGVDKDKVYNLFTKNEHPDFGENFAAFLEECRNRFGV